MNIKSRHKRRFFWTIVALIGLFVIGLICIPPFINLNKMKPILESKLYEQTGIITKINGNINFSLLGNAIIVAHDVQIPTGNIDNISFSVPFKQIFNLENATLNDEIYVNNAKITVTDLFPYSINHKINLYDSTVTFMDRPYKIVRGTLFKNVFNAQIRTEQHKYDINYNDGEFLVLNNNNNLKIRGTLFPDGGAAGEMSISTKNINKWFEFESPKISEPVDLSMDFYWDGAYGFDFTNIHANNYTGSINSLNFKSNDANLDLTFITQDKNMLNKTNINFDLFGKINFKQYTLSRFLVIAIGRNNKLEINHVIADNIELFGGTYDKYGLHNTKLQINNLPEKFDCDFSGNEKKWECTNFNYGDIYGNISQDNGIFKINATSTNKIPSQKTIRDLVSKIGESGTMNFTFSDMSGTMIITKKQLIPKLNYAQNTTLKEIGIDIKILPEFMLNTRGTFTYKNDVKKFIPENKQWTLDLNGNNFTITGTNFKHWLPNIDLRFIRDLPYAISGTYNENDVGDLNIMIAGQIISGNASKSGLTLNTNELDLDKFINPDFIDNYEEQKFLTNHPLATLFDIPINISLSSDILIFNNQEYNNFVYSLKPDTQIFSISDSMHGNLLAIIEKKKFDYDISIQSNNFEFFGNFLNFETPLNIENSTLTAEITLQTSGQTANDLIYNLSGDMDLTFNGGTISGFGFDKFYAMADKLSIINAEYVLASALESGTTKIKTLKIHGTYKNGNFETTKPFTLSMLHIDAKGTLSINNRVMTGTFDFVLRGTAPKPSSIELNINEYGKRTYSITEIINNMDIGYMRAFVKSNNKF